MVIKTVFDKSTEALTRVGCALASAYFNLSPEAAAATIGIAKIRDCLKNNPKAIKLDDLSGVEHVRSLVKLE